MRRAGVCVCVAGLFRMAAGAAAAQEAAEPFGNPWMKNLVDVEPPPPVPWWPPAPGWYALAGLVTLAVVWLLWRGARRWRSNAYRREGARRIRATRSMPPEAALDAIARVLKRVALTTCGRETVSSLSGAEWRAFLDRTGRTHEFSSEPGERLTTLRYAGRGESVSTAELETLRRISRRWILSHRAPAETRP